MGSKILEQPPRDLVICDLDGTLANDDARAHHLRDPRARDWGSYFAACGGDSPYHEIIQLVRLLKYAKKRIYIYSSRLETVRADTLEWLERHNVPYDKLVMRPEAERTDDHILKLKWLQDSGEADQVWLIIEDRNRVVQAWRDAGYVCLQVRLTTF
jgi:hypothetical protein